MSNSVKGETPLVLSDGREFTLVLDMEALLSIEDSTNKPLPQVMTQAAAGFVTAQAAIAHAAFARNHPDVTRAEVVEMLFTSDKEAIAEALASATTKAFPDAKPSAEGNGAAPKKRQAGKRSGRSGAKQG